MEIKINGKVENVESYLTDTVYVNGKDRFEIVEKIPRGFFVWNIGDYMGRTDFIPLCEPRHGSELPYIEPTTLKAIRLPHEDVKVLRKAASRGACDLLSAKEALTNADWDDERKGIAEMAVSIYERITEI